MADSTQLARSTNRKREEVRAAEASVFSTPRYQDVQGRLPQHRASDLAVGQPPVLHLAEAMKCLLALAKGDQAEKLKALVERLEALIPGEKEPELFVALNAILSRNRATGLVCTSLDTAIEAEFPDDGSTAPKLMYLLGSAMFFSYLLRKDQTVAAAAASSPALMSCEDRNSTKRSLDEIYYSFFRDNPEFRVLLTPLSRKEPQVDSFGEILSGVVAPMLALSEPTIWDRLAARFGFVRKYYLDGNFSSLKRDPENWHRRAPIYKADEIFFENTALLCRYKAHRKLRRRGGKINRRQLWQWYSTGIKGAWGTGCTRAN